MSGLLVWGGGRRPRGPSRSLSTSRGSGRRCPRGECRGTRPVGAPAPSLGRGTGESVCSGIARREKEIVGKTEGENFHRIKQCLEIIKLKIKHKNQMNRKKMPLIPTCWPHFPVN